MKQLLLCLLVVLTAGGLSAQSTDTRADEIRTSLRFTNHMSDHFDWTFRHDLRFDDLSLPRPALLFQTGVYYKWGEFWSAGVDYRYIDAPDQLESRHHAAAQLRCDVPLRSIPLTIQSRTRLIQQFNVDMQRHGGQLREQLRVKLSEDFNVRPFGQMEVFYQTGRIVGLQRTRYALGAEMDLNDRIRVDVSATRQRTKLAENIEGRMIYALTGRYTW